MLSLIDDNQKKGDADFDMGKHRKTMIFCAGAAPGNYRLLIVLAEAIVATGSRNDNTTRSMQPRRVWDFTRAVRNTQVPKLISNFV